MRQQLTNVSANKEELLRVYNKEQDAVTRLEQQLNSARKELERAKEESAVSVNVCGSFSLQTMLIIKKFKANSTSVSICSCMLPEPIFR